jgi:hypothetical protein
VGRARGRRERNRPDGGEHEAHREPNHRGNVTWPAKESSVWYARVTSKPASAPRAKLACSCENVPGILDFAGERFRVPRLPGGPRRRGPPAFLRRGTWFGCPRLGCFCVGRSLQGILSGAVLDPQRALCSRLRLVGEARARRGATRLRGRPARRSYARRAAT